MDFNQQNIEDWKKVLSTIFPLGIPESFSWTTKEEIILILEIIGSIANVNHMFYPNGGGLDLTGASKSNETNCIELHTGGLLDIINPRELLFEKISDDATWSYFRIETNPLKPSGVYENTDGHYEELTELHPNKYVGRHVWDMNEYNGSPLPKSSRVVSRYFKGSFVIFRKTSIYNSISSTYDGRHSKMSSEEFKQYIQKAAYKSYGV